MVHSHTGGENTSRRTALKRAAAAGSLLLTGVPASASSDTTEITESTTIDEPGEYKLASDIDTSGNGITIDAYDVTLDGNGHTLSGDGSGTGIQVVKFGMYSGITVTNVTAKGFQTGFENSEYGYNTVESSTFENNAGDGVNVPYGGQLTCNGCTIGQNGGTAVSMSEYTELSASDCNLRNNDGSAVAGGWSHAVSLTDSDVVGNGGGVEISPKPGTAVRGTRIRNNSGAGIETAISDFGTAPDSVPVENCEIRNNDGPGIRHDTGFLEIRGCTLAGNQVGYEWSTVERYPKHQAVLRHNNILNNAEYGVVVAHSRENVDPVDAECNYWGHPTGPDHEDNPRNNPKGQPVSDQVEYIAWSVERIEGGEGECVGGDGNDTRTETSSRRRGHGGKNNPGRGHGRGRGNQ